VAHATQAGGAAAGHRVGGHRRPHRVATHGGHRSEFAAGARLGSTVWFTALGYGAHLLRPVFARPAAWQILDGLIAAVMTALAISLALRGLNGA